MQRSIQSTDNKQRSGLNHRWTISFNLLFPRLPEHCQRRGGKNVRARKSLCVKFYLLDGTWPQDPWPHMHPIRETICGSGLPREEKSFFFGSMTTRRLLNAITEFQKSNSLDGNNSSWSYSVDLRYLMLESKKFWKRSKGQLKRTQKLSLRNAPLHTMRRTWSPN